MANSLGVSVCWNDANRILRAEKVYERIKAIIGKELWDRRHEWQMSIMEILVSGEFGGWSLEALRRYYGIPPQAVISKFGLEHLPEI